MTPKAPATTAWRRWNITLLSCLGIAAVALPVLNLTVDPYDLFGSPFGPGPTTNQRAAHVRALTSPSGRFDVWLAGTSVMGINDPRLVDELVPGARSYNMSMFLGTARDIVDLMRALGEQSISPKVLVVGIDPFLFLPQPRQPRIEFQMPPLVSGESSLRWWSRALFAPSAMQMVGKALDRLHDLPSVRIDTARGHYELPALSERLQKDLNAQRAQYSAAASFDLHRTLDQAQFEQLVELERLAARRHIKLVYVVQPPSRAWLDAAGGEQKFMEFVERVRRYTGSNVVLPPPRFLTDAPELWYDAKHYTPAAGAVLLSHIARDPKVGEVLSNARLAAP